MHEHGHDFVHELVTNMIIETETDMLIGMDMNMKELFRSLGRGLGCVLIKSTLGPGKTQKGWRIGRGGVRGSNGGQKGTVYEQPGTEVDISVTAGGRRVSRIGINKGKCYVQDICNSCRMNDE